MRKITHIVLHCTATMQDSSVAAIQRYWRENLGWKNPGYHYLIEANGVAHNLQDTEKIANGVAGHNANSIHISYIGGIDKKGNPKDNRTPQQVLATLNILIKLKEKYPDAIICGHRDFEGVTKACPSFDVKEWLKHVKL